MSDEQERTFDPARYLSLVNGKDYLEVKWRLVWFRDESPNGTIVTDLVSHDHNEAIFRATATRIGDGGEVLGLATGFGSEDAQSFGDYIEKAETKAIGRALAALGYGTQFSYDFSDVASGRIADAPVGVPQSSNTLAATDRQRNLIQTLARKLKFTGYAIEDLAQEVAGAPLADLTRKGASDLIEAMNARQEGTSEVADVADPARSKSRPKPNGSKGAVDGKAVHWRERLKLILEPMGWGAEQLDGLARMDHETTFESLNGDQMEATCKNIEAMIASDDPAAVTDLFRHLVDESQPVVEDDNATLAANVGKSMAGAL